MDGPGVVVSAQHPTIKEADADAREIMLSECSVITPPRGEPMKPEWISVEDRLPEMTGHVLALSNDIVNSWQQVINAYVCPEYGNVIWEGLDGEDYLPIVTHWMPLPEPPCA